jgi:threonine synthase
MNLYCPICGSREPLQTKRWRCACGEPFLLEGVPPFRRDAVRPGERGLWRYRDLLPALDAEPVTMGEGGTPLLLEEWAGLRVGFKLEFISPTGSFKDRGTAVLVSFLRSWGVGEVVDDSSGNAGASLAAYGARAGLRVRIFAPAHTSPAKLAQISVYGAEIVAVPGPRPRATEAALEAVAAGAYYASHAYHPLFVEGVATLAYEVLENLGWRVPDNMIFPVGNGSLLFSTYLAVKRMQAAGAIEHLPRLFAVQARGCAPLMSATVSNVPNGTLEATAPRGVGGVAWEKGAEDVAPLDSGQTGTLAEGIAVTQPSLGRYVLQALRETGGAVVAVEDADILSARQALARRGLYVEPTAAATVAALPQLRDWIGPHELSVLPLTGHGLKST